MRLKKVFESAKKLYKNDNKKENEKKSRLGLYYWSPNDHRGKENFGDYMSKVIVGNVLKRHKYKGGVDLTGAIEYNLTTRQK